MSIVDQRCPSCGALARGDLAWCTLCHADLRPAEAAAPPAVLPLDPLTAPLDQLLAAVDAGELPVAPPEAPPTVAGATAEPDGDRAEAADDLATLDTDVMFALLRGQSQDPLLAKFGNRFQTKASRFAFMVGGATLLALVFFGLITVVGLVVG